MSEPSAGTLFLVATPIGNLEDITLRALRVLREATLVAAEDTRRTSKLLAHYDIRTPTTSLHEHNERGKLVRLIERLKSGEHVALVSDAGTPGVSDPGFLLVRAAIDAGIRVEPIPGPSAVLTALSASGLPSDGFVFVGFPPSRAREKRAWFGDLRDERRTLVLFEAPHRILGTLAIALEEFGDRLASVGRELTKVHEQWVRGPISEIARTLPEPRGEYTLVIGGKGRDVGPQNRVIPTPCELAHEFGELTESGLTRRGAISALAKKYGLHARDVYQAVLQTREP